MRKKLLTFLVSTGLVFSLSSAFAFDMDIKLGASGPADAKQVGFDGAVSFNFPVIAMSEQGVGFSIGIQPGFQWVSWEKGLGVYKSLGGVLQAEVTADTNVFLVPVLLTLQARFPVYLGDQASAFYVNLGAGYSFGSAEYSVPEYTNTSSVLVPAVESTASLSGFTYEAIAGFAFAANTNLSIFAEAGYRGADTETDDGFKYDMSGWVARVGARLKFGGSSY